MAIPPLRPRWEVHPRQLVELLPDHRCHPAFTCGPGLDAARWPVPYLGDDLDLDDLNGADTAWMTWEAPR